MIRFIPIGRSNVNPALPGEHAYPDSAATATRDHVGGVKTYNDAIDCDPTGGQVPTVAREAPRSRAGNWRRDQRAHQPRHARLRVRP